MKRDPDFDYQVGMRAHPSDMSWTKCLWSLLVPWHNEWLNIWLYLAFSIYFWVECILIMARSKTYGFQFEKNWDFMFVATLSIAVSFSMTTGYLIFYSMSEHTKLLLDGFDYMGKLILVFGFTFAWTASELINSPIYFYFMFFVVAVLAVNLVLVQYPKGRTISFWVTIGLISCVYVYDFAIYSTPKQKRVFYIPIFVEGLILGAGWLMYYFQIPERLCRGSRFVQLYLTGYHFYTLFLINFVFEAHQILYYAIKLNAGNYDDYYDNWWRIDNIFHKTPEAE